MIALTVQASNRGSGLEALSATTGRFSPPWTVEDMLADRPMTAEQAATLKQLAKAAYELDAFKPNITRAEAGAKQIYSDAKRAALLSGGLKSEPAQSIWSGNGRLDAGFAERRIGVSFFEATYQHFLVTRMYPG